MRIHTYVLFLLLLLGCSDSPTTPSRPPDMSGGWAAVVGCVPTNCVVRLWAQPRLDPDGATRYVTTDTLFSGNGAVRERRVGLMFLNVNHIVISFDVSGTRYQTWSMSGDFGTLAGGKPDYSQFSARESWRYADTGQGASQGPWTFRKIP